MVSSLVMIALAVAALVLLMRVYSAPPPPWARRRHVIQPANGDYQMRRKDGYTQVGVSRTYVQPALPGPGDNSPLTPLLAKAVDRVVPVGSPGEAVPFDEAEVKRVMQGAVDRVNAGAPGLDLVLVAVDNARKSVDRYKTLKYEADIGVYSKTRNISSKVAAAVDVSSAAGGKTYIRTLRVHGAAKDDASPVAPSNGIGKLEQYAAFEPALKYW